MSHKSTLKVEGLHMNQSRPQEVLAGGCLRIIYVVALLLSRLVVTLLLLEIRSLLAREIFKILLF